MSESKVEILKALNAMMQEVSFVPKEKNPNLKYEIVSYDGLLDEVRHLAVKHGLVMIAENCQQINCTPYEVQRTGYDGEAKLVHINCDSYVFKFRMWHTSGEYLDCMTPAIGVDEADKGPGKAMTYARKYAWMTFLMLKSGEDPDHTPSSNYQKSTPQQSRPQQQSTTQPAKKPGPVELTHDRKTWPKQWQDVFQYLYDNAVKAELVENDDDFNWITNVTKVKEELMAKEPPVIILDETLSWYTVALVGAALKTRHKAKTVVSVLKNRDVFVSYVGYEEAMKRFARLEEIRAELGTAIDPNEIPF